MDAQQGLWELTSDRRPDSTSSTPYESATCSPRSSTDRAISCFFSACTPTCPVQVTVNFESSTGLGFVPSSIVQLEEPASDDFDFSARFSEVDQPWSPAPMSSADELFCNGQIRPLWCTSEDFTYLYAQSEHNYDDDDDSHFDFRSSADYKFTMLSMQHSPGSVMDELLQHVGDGFSGQYHDQDQPCLHRPVSDASMEDVRDKGDGVQETAKSLPRQASRRRDVGTIEKHIMKIKVEESRGRRAGGSSIRRTRSLSPLRVFHMDDEAPRQSCETEQSFQSAKEDKEQEEKSEGGETVRRKGARLTLKELLHASEQTEQGLASKMGARIGSKQQVKAGMEGSNLRFKSSLTHSMDNSTRRPTHVVHGQGARSLHGLHYSSPRVHTEQMRQQTFLPYRRGVLGCLGFTSKSYRCMAGFKSFHSKSKGSR